MGEGPQTSATPSKRSVNIYVDATDAVAKLNAATKAAEDLKRALDALKDFSIKLNVERAPVKKWWQFWK